MFAIRGRLLERLEPESGWQGVFCVNTGGQQLGFIAEIKGHSGQVQHRDLWVPLGEIAEHPTALCTSIKLGGAEGEFHSSKLVVLEADLTHHDDE